MRHNKINIDYILLIFKLENNILYRLSLKSLTYRRVKHKARYDGQSWINIDKKRYPTSRIVWSLANEKSPDGYDVDHIDCNRLNNNPSNLRLASRMENCQNKKKAYSNSKTGELGVSVCKKKGKFIASISINKKYYRKYFKTLEEARSWYINKKREIHHFSTI